MTKQVQNKTQEKRPLPLAIGDYRPLQLRLQVGALIDVIRIGGGPLWHSVDSVSYWSKWKITYGQPDVRSNSSNKIAACCNSRRSGRSGRLFQNSRMRQLFDDLLFAMLPPSFIGEAWLHVE